MKDANGVHVDVSSTGDRLLMPNDLTVIRINVDDFDEAMIFFLYNFKNLYVTTNRRLNPISHIFYGRKNEE